MGKLSRLKKNKKPSRPKKQEKFFLRLNEQYVSKEVPYIHWHSSNYNNEEGELLAWFYFAQKSNALFSYKNSFKQHLSLSALEFLNSLENTSDDSVIQQMNEAIVYSVQDAIERTNTNLATFGDDITIFRNKYKNLFSQTRVHFNDLKNFLNDVHLLFSKIGYEDTFINDIIYSLPKNYTLTKGYSKSFLEYLDNYIKLNEGKILKTKNNIPAINFIETLTKRMYNDKKNTFNFGPKKMTNAITSIFNQDAGEYAIAEAISTLVDEGENKIIDHLLTGQARVSVAGKDNKKHSVQIKPDVTAPGIKITYDPNGSNAFMSFQTDIGASVKTYSSKAINSKWGVSIGSRYVWNDLLKLDNKIDKYHAANTLTYSNKGANYLYGALIKQNIHLLLSGNNQNNTNFANILVVNGKVYSMYDIIAKIQSERNIRVLLNDFVGQGLKKAPKASWQGGAPSEIYANMRSTKGFQSIKELKYKVSLRMAAFSKQLS